MADAIHGNGLYVVDDSLARLVANPAALDQARRRFGGDGDDDPPPPYYSPLTPSGANTRPESPSLPAVEGPEAAAARRAKLKDALLTLHRLSLPREQFASQSYALALRLAMLRYSEHDQGRPFPAPRTNERSSSVAEHIQEAEAVIRARWQEQGIWSDAWPQTSPPSDARWQHEPPGTHTQNHTLPSRSRRSRTRATEAAAAAAPSRPYNQFVYQVAKERDLLLGLAGDLDPPPLPRRKPWTMRVRRPGDPLLSAADERAADQEYERRRQQSRVAPRPAPLHKAPADVHTTAYETVKAAWVYYGIWDKRWTVMPGLHWTHEEPLGKFIRRRMAEEDGEEWNDDDGDSSGDDDDNDDDRLGQQTAASPSPPPTPARHLPLTGIFAQPESCSVFGLTPGHRPQLLPVAPQQQRRPRRAAEAPQAEASSSQPAKRTRDDDDDDDDDGSEVAGRVGDQPAKRSRQM